MPKSYRKRSRRSSSSLPAPIALIAKSAARQFKRDQLIQQINDSAQYFGDTNRASRNIGLRYDRMAARGQGAYKFGRALSRWGAGKFGQAIQGAGTNMAVTGMNKVTEALGQGLYTGMGAYANELIPGKSDLAMIPSFSSSGDETGALTISHKEYIGDIYGPTTPFNVQSYSINPGLETTFPWLSQIAQNYDEYQIHQLIFTFRSTTTDIGSNTNGQCGTVVMGTNYNAGAPAWRDKVTMMEYDAVMSGKATESLLHGVECDPTKLSGSDGKYVRSSPVPQGQDVKTYDQGLFQLAVCNSPAGYANNSIGELWVSYTVTLRKPKFFTARGLGISQDIFVSYGGETRLQLLGPTANYLRAQANNINTLVTVSDNLIKLTFPATYTGYLLITLWVEGTLISNTGVVPASITKTGNIDFVSDIYGSQAGGAGVDTPTYYIASASATSSLFILHVFVSGATGGIENVLNLVTGAGDAGAAITQSQLKIQEYNSGFSYRSNNLGTSDAPILVNSAGQIVVP